MQEAYPDTCVGTDSHTPMVNGLGVLAWGVGAVPLANRATIGNMSPEYGSTVSMFPIDDFTLQYMALTGRSAEQITLVKEYAKAQGLWHDPEHEPRYSERLELDLSTVVPSIAGPKRPQDRIVLSNVKPAFVTTP